MSDEEAKALGVWILIMATLVLLAVWLNRCTNGWYVFVGHVMCYP